MAKYRRASENKSRKSAMNMSVIRQHTNLKRWKRRKMLNLGLLELNGFALYEIRRVEKSSYDW